MSTFQSFYLNPCILRCINHCRRYRYSLLSSGNLTAHESSHLVLLGSPPDTVHEFSLRKTKTSTPLIPGGSTAGISETGHHLCYSGLQIQGTANSPASTEAFNRFFYVTARPGSRFVLYLQNSCLVKWILCRILCFPVLTQPGFLFSKLPEELFHQFLALLFQHPLHDLYLMVKPVHLQKI